VAWAAHLAAAGSIAGADGGADEAGFGGAPGSDPCATSKPCRFDGLVARWPLDDDFADAAQRFVGSALDVSGAPSNTPGFVPGIVANAADFRAANALVRIAPDPALTPLSFSLVFWANSPQASLDFPEVLVSKGRDCLANYECAILPQGKLRCLINDGRGWCEDSLTVSTPWPTLVWTHVAFTVDDDPGQPMIHLQLFVNGALVDRVDVADSFVVNNPEWPLLFGGHYQEPTGVGVTPYFSRAWLDEVELYDRVLSAREIRAQYDAAF